MQCVQMKNTGETNPVIRGSNVVEDVHNLRLMTLLRHLVRKRTAKGVAGELGLDPRTVATCLREGRLSERVQRALEENLKSGLELETARQRECMDNLERKLTGLEDKQKSALEGIEEAMQRELDVLRRECARGLRALEKRLDRLENGGGPGKTVKEAPTVDESRTLKPPWRLYPDLVTPEAEPGEEDVYGDAALLVVDWRRAMEAVQAGRDGVAGLDARARLLEVEIELIEKYQFTLPPSTYPWHDSERKEMVRFKSTALKVVRAQRKWAILHRRIRRMLTLGLWRN